MGSPFGVVTTCTAEVMQVVTLFLAVSPIEEER